MYIIEKAVNEQTEWFRKFIENNPTVKGSVALEEILNKNLDALDKIMDALYIKASKNNKEINFTVLKNEFKNEIQKIDDVDYDSLNCQSTRQIAEEIFNLLSEKCIEIGLDNLIFFKNVETGSINLTPEFEKTYH